MLEKLGRLRPSLKGHAVLLMLVGCFFLCPAAASADDASYTFTLTGIPDGEPKALFDQTSDLELLAAVPPPSPLALSARLDGDQAKARQILSAFGYFDAVVKGQIDDGVKPPQVTLTVAPGQPYHISTIRVQTADGARLGPVLSPDLSAGPLKPGDHYRASAVLAAEATILTTLGRKSYPFATLIHRDVAADPATRHVAITWTVDRGPSARFGPVTFDGLGRTRDKIARRLIAWEGGAPVDLALVEKTRRAFVATGLYRTVEIKLGQPAAADGAAPVTISLTEAPPRTIGAGLRYSTSDGFGIHGLWEHRNLFGGREDLKLEADVAEIGYALTAKLTKPDFLWHNVDLSIQSFAQTQNLPAYDTTGAFLGSGLTWHVGADIDRPNPVVDLSAVAIVQQEHVDPGTGARDFTIFGLQLGAARNTSDDLLEPTRGYRVAFNIAPYHSLGDTGANFLKTTLDGTVYVPLDATSKRLVFAARANFGSLVGADRVDVPPDYLFYAGGGASIRGFAYQYAGPVKDDTPKGGRSLATASAELRWYVTEDIGIVPFMDIGSVYGSQIPDFSGPLYGGAGIGLRYRSPAGPLRLDIATPVIGKRRIDSAVEVYISIGQAF